jgi:hypothetical protein
MKMAYSHTIAANRERRGMGYGGSRMHHFLCHVRTLKEDKRKLCDRHNTTLVAQVFRDIKPGGALVIVGLPGRLVRTLVQMVGCTVFRHDSAMLAWLKIGLRISPEDFNKKCSDSIEMINCFISSVDDINWYCFSEG